MFHFRRLNLNLRQKDARSVSDLYSCARRSSFLALFSPRYHTRASCPAATSSGGARSSLVQHSRRAHASTRPRVCNYRPARVCIARWRHRLHRAPKILQLRSACIGRYEYKIPSSCVTLRPLSFLPRSPNHGRCTPVCPLFATPGEHGTTAFHQGASV